MCTCIIYVCVNRKKKQCNTFADAAFRTFQQPCLICDCWSYWFWTMITRVIDQTRAQIVKSGGIELVMTALRLTDPDEICLQNGLPLLENLVQNNAAYQVQRMKSMTALEMMILQHQHCCFKCSWIFGCHCCTQTAAGESGAIEFVMTHVKKEKSPEFEIVSEDDWLSLLQCLISNNQPNQVSSEWLLQSCYYFSWFRYICWINMFCLRFHHFSYSSV